MVVEYLIVLKSDSSFCNTNKSFKSLLTVDESISLNNNNLIFQTTNNSLTVEFKLRTGTIDEKDERYFLLELNCVEDNRIELFTKLCHKVKKIVEKINPNSISINTLRNDIGTKYSSDAYPIINNVENVMRKLITKFMIEKVGMEWVTTEIHKDLHAKIEKKSSNNDLLRDSLYKMDFIELSDVLFKKYRKINQNELDNIIRKAKSNEDIDLNILNDSLPKSNWERYFSNIINFKQERLEKNWKELYKLRNNVAHNRYLTIQELSIVKKLSQEIIKQLNDAIDSLDKIHIGKEEQELILDSFEMYPTIRLVKAAKELNLRTGFIVEVLRQNGYDIENKPTEKITNEMFDIISNAVKNDPNIRNIQLESSFIGKDPIGDITNPFFKTLFWGK